MGLAELVIDSKEIGNRLQVMLGNGYRVRENGWTGILVEMMQDESFVPFANVYLPANDFDRIAVSEELAIRNAAGPIRIVRGSIFMKIIRELESMSIGTINYTKQPTDDTYCPN